MDTQWEGRGRIHSYNLIQRYFAVAAPSAGKGGNVDASAIKEILCSFY